MKRVFLFLFLIVVSQVFSGSAGAAASRPLINPSIVRDVLQELWQTETLRPWARQVPALNYEIFFRPVRPSLSSWTLPSFETLIFIPSREMSAEEFNREYASDPRKRTFLAQVLAHELAIFLDNKQRILLGKNGNVSWKWQPGDPRMAVLLGTLEHPAVAYSTAAARAFQVEERVMLELSRLFPQKYVYDARFYSGVRFISTDSGRCREFVTRMLSQCLGDIKSLTALSGPVPIANLYTGEIGIPQSFEELIRPPGAVATFLDWEIEMPEGRRQSLCTERATPELGVSHSRQLSNGPRPFSTGGSGD